MKEELLWSWNSDKPSTDKIQLNLSILTEKIIVVIAISAIFIILLMYITPLLGNWSYYVLALLFLILVPYMLNNYKNKEISKEQSNLEIYNNRIYLNLQGYHGNYNLENIAPDSIRIKYIIVTNFMGVGFSKGLCFKTQKPAMNVKVPLPLLEPDLSELNSVIKALTRRSSWTNNP